MTSRKQEGQRRRIYMMARRLYVLRPPFKLQAFQTSLIVNDVGVLFGNHLAHIEQQLKDKLDEKGMNYRDITMEKS